MKLYGLVPIAFLSSVINAQNAPIITSPISNGDNQTVFDAADSRYASVTCEPNKMCITLSEEYFLNIRGHQVFDMAQVKLDQPCGGTTEMVGPNKTMCTLNIESQTCGLSMSMNNTHVSYETTVKTEANEMNFPNGNTTIITYNIPFMCTYPLDYLLTLESETGEKYGHYIPQIYQVQIITILFQNGGEGIGRFPVAMMLFKDESYGPVYSSAPSINVSDTVYVGIILGESPEGAVIQARQCWATPTENPEDPVRVSLIDNFCSDNEETGVNIINNGNSNRAKWTTKAFKFAGPNYDKVFLHCWAKVCFNIDGGPSCDMIGSCGRRKKRAVGATSGEIYMDNSEINEDLTPNGEVVLTVGPITVKDLQDLITPDPVIPEERGLASMFLNPVIGTVTIVSLIIIMMVLVGMIVIIMRRRSNSQSIKQ